MCGIFGCVGKIEKSKVCECINTIKHRGPDALEVKELRGATFAHARLSIIDLSQNANQPMLDETGRYCIVFNGEIYNYLELKKELKDLGYQFKTNSDTEVLLYSYIEWGEKFQEKCNGMWAVAIWDNYEEELFLSRDRFGIKPLYYYKRNDMFVFASEMKAIIPVMKKIDYNYSIFAQKNYFAYEATEKCVINDIYKVQAGKYLRLKNGNHKLTTWWRTIDNLIDVPENYDEQAEMFRELFLDSCKIRMRSDVPIGTALSGGVDSSVVAGAMHHLSTKVEEVKYRDWQNAFVASMPGTMYDETNYAEIAAKHIDIEVQKVNINGQVSPEELEKYIYLCEDPYITSPIVFMQTYGAIRQRGVKVTLDGHGADELFGGYGFDVLLAGADIGINSEYFRKIVNTYNEMSPKENYRTDMEARQEIITGLKGITCDSRISRLPLDNLNKRLYQETHFNVLPTLLRCYDRYSMANGVEIRMPFMDYRIVSFAFSIPWSSKIRNGFSKAIVRDMARPYMTNEILNRKLKIGFNSPMSEWFKTSLKDYVIDIVNSSDFRQCELINSLDITVQVNEFMKSEKIRFQDGEDIWTKIIPYLWEKVMIRGNK